MRVKGTKIMIIDGTSIDKINPSEEKNKIFINVPEHIIGNIVKENKLTEFRVTLRGMTYRIRVFNRNSVFITGRVSDVEELSLTFVNSIMDKIPEDVMLPQEIATIQMINDLVNTEKQKIELEDSARKNYLIAIDTRKLFSEKVKLYKSKLYELSRHKLNNDKNIYFNFKNVTATDTDEDGKDIYLGDISISVNLESGKCNIIKGQFPKTTYYNNKAFHPHHLTEYICLGTQVADMADAVQNLNFGKIKAILSKFVHSYTSSDSAGKYWRFWDSENDWVEIGDEFYLHDETVYSNYESQYLYEGDAVYIESMDDYVSSNNCVWSDKHGCYLFSKDACYITYSSDYIYSDDIAIVENSNYVIDTGNIPDNVVYLDGQYYFKDDENVATTIDDEFRLKSDCVYSNALCTFIPKDEAVLLNEDWYTESTLPKEVEEVQQ